MDRAVAVLPWGCRAGSWLAGSCVKWKSGASQVPGLGWGLPGESPDPMEYGLRLQSLWHSRNLLLALFPVCPSLFQWKIQDFSEE